MKKIFGISISIMISVNIISTTAFGFAVNVYDDNTVTTQNISRKNKIDYQYRILMGFSIKGFMILPRISP